MWRSINWSVVVFRALWQESPSLRRLTLALNKSWAPQDKIDWLFQSTFSTLDQITVTGDDDCCWSNLTMDSGGGVSQSPEGNYLDPANINHHTSYSNTCNLLLNLRLESLSFVWQSLKSVVLRNFYRIQEF